MKSIHTLSILAYNHPGVTSRITSLFTRRGYNLESITAGKSEEEGKLRFVIQLVVTEKNVEQISKQLYKILDVSKVSIVDKENHVAKELAFIKMKKDKTLFNSDIFQLIRLFNGKVVDLNKQGFIIELVETTQMIDSFIELIPKGLISKITRSGNLSIDKWPQTSV